MVVNMRNYNREMNDILAALQVRPRLLLHCCCGPCATSVVEKLDKFFDITLYYYNPNTYPEREYYKRLNVLKAFVEKAYPDIAVIEEKYDPDEYNEAVKGISDTREGGIRCHACIALRLDRSAEYAARNGYDCFCSTLSVSPLKDSRYINSVGEALEKKYNIKYLINDFKKEDGYRRSVEMSKQYGMYRQNYCGCRASLEIREKTNG